MCEPNTDNFDQSKWRLLVFDQDLNLPPNNVGLSESELFGTQMTEESSPGMTMRKKKRAASKDVAKISYEDLAMYFGLPIIEASRNLDVGVTVLKKKCRELGIPRWPHRKIKSLDSLIQNLQEEAERQQQENNAAEAVEKRQKMLESEKESIERKPFMEIQTETKRFRQDVFKRRHRARALNNTEGPSTSTSP